MIDADYHGIVLYTTIVSGIQDTAATSSTSTNTILASTTTYLYV